MGAERVMGADPALKVVEGVKPWTSAVETNPLSTSPNSGPISEAAAGNATTP